MNRDDVLLGVQELGVDLDAHIQFVIDAMRRSADALGLARHGGVRRRGRRPPDASTFRFSRPVYESGYRPWPDDRNHPIAAVRHDVIR